MAVRVTASRSEAAPLRLLLARRLPSLVVPLCCCAAAAVAVGRSVPDRWPQPGEGVSLPGGPWIQTASDVQRTGNHLCARMRKPDGLWGGTDCVYVQPGHTYVNDGGRFAIQPLPALPGGTWISTAQNIRREGNLMFAELQRENLTWAPVAIVLEPHHYFQNIDGALFRQNAGCLSLGSCLHSFALKVNSFVIYCANLYCDPYIDLDTCCDPAEPCTTVDWCILPKVIDTTAYCDGMTCEEERDYDKCCVGRAKCSSFDCPYGFVLRLDAAVVQCASFECDPGAELGLCCEQQARCSTLVNEECEHGRYFNPIEFCAQTTCDEFGDRYRCCPLAASCEDFMCPLGFTPLPNQSMFYCNGPTCVTVRDAESCCLPAMPCENISDTCSFGTVVVPGTYCDGVFCFPERDTRFCCQRAELCTGLNDTSCPLGYFFNNTDYCKGKVCMDERDHDTCCQVAEPCSHFDCPYGALRRPNPLVTVYSDEPPYEMLVESLYCLGSVCDFGRDLTQCCDVQASCTDFECPEGWVHTWNASISLCLGSQCVAERDTEVCCDRKAVCAEEFTCPHGWVAKAPTVWCANVECNATTDVPNCCDTAMPCTNLTCPENFVHRPNTYCSKAAHFPNACTLEVDKDMCCERGMALKFYRFRPIAVKDERAYQVQLSEFNLYFYGELVAGSKTAQGGAAFSVGGNFPDAERPEMAIDEDLDTKWLDEDPEPKYTPGRIFEWKPLTVMLPSVKPIDAYSFHTGNDIPERDPITWLFEGSFDNETWVLLDQQEDVRGNITDDRLTETPHFGIMVPCFLPLPVHILNSNSEWPCLEGYVVQSGGNCTASCQTGYVPTPTTLSCNEGELAPRSFVCTAV